MPRTSVSGILPNWDRLFEVASAQAGYVTNAQAHEAGYSLPLLQFYVHKGRLERVQRGILRLVHYHPGEHEDLVPLWLWSEQEGVFSHGTARMLHNLSDALPGKRPMTVPASWSKRRLRLPRGLVLHFADLPKAAMTWLGPVPLTTPLRTVADCARRRSRGRSRRPIRAARRPSQALLSIGREDRAQPSPSRTRCRRRRTLAPKSSSRPPSADPHGRRCAGHGALPAGARLRPLPRACSSALASAPS